MKASFFARLLTAATILFGGFTFAPTATEAASKSKVLVSADILNVRSTSSVKGKKLGHLSLGQAVTVEAKTANGWYKVSYGGKTGYILATYTKPYRLKTEGLTKAGASIVAVAEGLKGRPYVYGATGAYGFDCSGLTSYVYKALGKKLPRTAAAQYAATARTAPQAGDLVFFSHGGGIQHVGIAVDGSTMINANSYYGKVMKESFRSGYWGSKYVGAGTL